MKKHHQTYAVKLGERVKTLREGKNLTHHQLAEKCGCSTKTISRIEKGETNFSHFILVDMAIVFGISLEELVRG